MKDTLVSTVKVSVSFLGHLPKRGSGYAFSKGYSTPDFLERMYVKRSCLFKTVSNSTDMDRNLKTQEINELPI